MGYMKRIVCLFVAVSVLVSSVVASDAPAIAPEAAPAPGMVGAPGPNAQKPRIEATASSSALPLEKISLPPGFQISLFTPSPVEANPRSLAINSPSGGKDLIVYVGTDAPAPKGVVSGLSPDGSGGDIE